jgi:hypothetical protein
VVLLTRLVAGQRAVVLQLPAAARPTVGAQRTVVVEPAYERWRAFLNSDTLRLESGPSCRTPQPCTSKTPGTACDHFD